MPSKGSIPRICEQCGVAFGVDPCEVRRGRGRFCSPSCAAKGRTRADPLNRFWRSINKGPTGCWLWMATKTTGGYGVFWADGRLHKAHRWSYELRHGTIPAGLNALHRCDTPACVNPDHLFLGSHADNVADMRAKGRGFNIPREKTPRGEGNGQAKLTEQQVRDIRAARATGEQLKIIARRYNVALDTISSICLGKHWRHVE